MEVACDISQSLYLCNFKIILGERIVFIVISISNLLKSYKVRILIESHHISFSSNNNFHELLLTNNFRKFS